MRVSPRVRRIVTAGAVACIAFSLASLSGCDKSNGKQADAAAQPLLIAAEDVLVRESGADVRPVDHRLGPARAPRRPARRGLGDRAAGAQGERRRGAARRPAGAPGRHRDPRQPRLGRGGAARAATRPSTRPSASCERMKTLRELGHDLGAGARRRRGAAATPRRASSRPPRRASSLRASSCSAPRCARRSTASSATARSRPATPRRSARSCSR